MKLGLSLAISLTAMIGAGSVASACPSGTCPTTTSSTPGAKPSGGQAAQPSVASGAAAQADPVAIVAPSSPDVLSSGDYLQRETFDCSDFQRGDNGGWTALRAVSFPAPEGSLKISTGSVYRPGQYVGGYDLGSMLEHACPR